MIRTSRTARAALALVLALVALAAAPVGAQDGEVPRPRDRAWTRAFFVDVLDREPTASEEQGVAELLYLNARSKVARQLVWGVENLEQEVTELYQEALGRAPEPEARHFWVERLRTGYPLREVVARVQGSREFFFRVSDGTFDAWYENHYQILLGRSITQAEREYWESVFSAKGPVGVVRRIYESGESRRRRVAEVYDDVLGRTPSGPDLTFWVQQAMDDIVFVHRLVLTDEYDARAQDRYGPN